MNLIAGSINSSAFQNYFNKKQFDAGCYKHKYPVKNPLSFKSIPVYEINIKNAAGKPVRALITKFDPSNAEDKKNLEALKDNWNKKFPSSKDSCSDYINYIYESFIKKNSNHEQFWALELLNTTENAVDRIVGFVEFFKLSGSKANNEMHISRIIVRDDISHKNPVRTIQYVGNSIFYALSNYFKGSDFDILKLASGNGSYYNRIKIPKLYNQVDRFIDKKNANEFMQNLRGADNFDFDIKSCNQEYKVCINSETFFFRLKKFFSLS